MKDNKDQFLGRESTSIAKEHKKKTSNDEKNTVKSEKLRYKNADEIYD